VLNQLSENIKSKSPPKRMNCIRCEASHPFKDGFYSTSDIDFYPLGKLPVCKDCCQKNIEKKGFDGFMDLLRLINKPLLEDNFKEDFFEYIKNVNSLPQFRGTTFLQSTKFESNRALESIQRAKPKELSEEDLRESEDFWGTGKPEEHYIWLNMQFSDYLSRYEVDSKTLEDLITEICLTRLDIRTRREAGLDVDKQIKTLEILLTSANLKPSQETGNQSVEQQTFGTLIKQWEDTRPIQDDSEWRKNDTVGEYLKVWFTGHLMRFFNIENKDEDEYFEEINKYTVQSDEGDEDGRN
jgi:hypothetical protein